MNEEEKNIPPTNEETFEAVEELSTHFLKDIKLQVENKAVQERILAEAIRLRNWVTALYICLAFTVMGVITLLVIRVAATNTILENQANMLKNQNAIILRLDKIDKK